MQSSPQWMGDRTYLRCSRMRLSNICCIEDHKESMKKQLAPGEPKSFSYLSKGIP